MTAPKHTPGPWFVDTNGYGMQFVYGGDSTRKISPMGVPYNSLVCGGDNPGTLSVEDAHLIAAAPDMLAELKRLLEIHGYQSTADVIAKAEGR